MKTLLTLATLLFTASVFAAPYPAPVANLTVNGRTTINVKVGQPLTYNWSSEFVQQVKSYYFTTNKPDSCEGGFSAQDFKTANVKPWVVNVANQESTVTANVAPCQAGVNYTIVLIGIGQSGRTEKAEIKVNVE